MEDTVTKPLLGGTPNESIELYRLETEFFGDQVRHTRHSPDTNQIKTEDWTVCEELGSGSFGVVHKHLEKQTGQLRAVKTIDQRRYRGLPPRYSIRELHIMAILAKHSSLFVEFLGWFGDSETLYLAMEYIELGDLRKHLDGPLREATVREIAKQLLAGLQVMHEAGMAHRDLKPDNIFVVSLSPIRVKLGDFGISKQAGVNSGTDFKTEVFTEAYAAPEVLGIDLDSESSYYTNAVDIWSFGCVLYELLTGKKLFETRRNVSKYWRRESTFPAEILKELSPPISDSGISFINYMVAPSPKGRPSAVAAAQAGWLVGYQVMGWESLAGLDLVSGVSRENTYMPSSKAAEVETGDAKSIELYKLETEFDGDHIRHKRYSPDTNQIETEDWTVCEVLGHELFGDIHKHLEKRTGQLRAVKTIDLRKYLAQHYAMRELHIIAILAKHPSLFVQSLGWFENSETLYLAMEYIELGDIAMYMNRPLPEATVQEITRQLLVGIRVMHEAGIAHRDLKPEKIFIVSLSPIRVKLGGFGISKQAEAGGGTYLHTLFITETYAAPEVLGYDLESESSYYTNASDIWSLGCVLYKLLTGKILFKSSKDVLRYCVGMFTFPAEILKGLPSPIGGSGISLIKDMVAPSPKERPSAVEAARAVWLVEG